MPWTRSSSLLQPARRSDEFVRETLTRATDAERVEAILRMACEMAGRDAIPEDPAMARWFVDEPLRVSLAHSLGPVMANALADEISRALEVTATPLAQTGKVASPTEEETQEHPAIGPRVPKTPLILVATHDRGSLQRLAMQLLGRAKVQPVRTLDGVAEGLRMTGERRVVIVLDACYPVLDPAAVAVEMGGHGAPLAVVLWGGGARARERVSAVGGGATWLHTPPEMADGAVGDLIGSLLA
ncbi:MAG: hypothetical protein OEY14_10680 [Myxococcales bacterium]|nr:hypothetical protein [Myxococcales bacterium]